MHNVEKDRMEFKPMGEKVHEYQVETDDGEEGDYEVYKVMGLQRVESSKGVPVC